MNARSRSMWLHAALLVAVYGTSGGIALGLASLAVSSIRGCI